MWDIPIPFKLPFKNFVHTRQPVVETSSGRFDTDTNVKRTTADHQF